MSSQEIPDAQGIWLPSLRPGQSDGETMLTSLAQLYVHGLQVDWVGFNNNYTHGKVSGLPTYPFQRQRYWFQTCHQPQSNPSQTDCTDSIEQTEIVRFLNRGDSQSLLHLLERHKVFTEEQQQLVSEVLDLLSRQQQQQLQIQQDKVVLELYYDAQSHAGFFSEGFLNFIPLPEVVPNFSSVLLGSDPNHQTEAMQLVRISHREMRDVLFHKVNFSACQKILDFGCGYGTDLLLLAQKYPHLQLDGYTLSDQQLKTAIEKATALDVHDRIHIFKRDSSSDPFPDQYDLVLGCEVACHIKDKEGLFFNISSHLNQNGMVVLADFVSHADFSIDHAVTSSYLATTAEWVKIVSANHLRFLKAIDMSQEVANSLYNPDFENNLEDSASLKHDLTLKNDFASNSNIKEALNSCRNQRRLLTKGSLSYVLLTAQKEDELSVEELEYENFKILSRLDSYRHYCLRQWLYEVSWQPQQSSAIGTIRAAEPGNWIFFADTTGVAQQMAASLQTQGHTCVVVQHGNTYQRQHKYWWQLDPERPEDFQRLFQEISQLNSLPLKGVLHCWSLDSVGEMEMSIPELEQAQLLGCGSALHLLQALAQMPADDISLAKLWLVTRGAVCISQDTSAPVNVAQSPLWGMGRVIALEHPHLWGGMLDLPPDSPLPDVEQLLSDVLMDPPAVEDHIAYRKEQRYVARLVRIQLPALHEVEIKPDGTYLITGGLGALGLRIAHGLLERGARYLVLMSRRGTDQAQTAIASLQKPGIQVQVVQVDVSNPAEVAARVAELKKVMPPLRGLIHAAGLSGEFQELRFMTWDQLRAVLSPKVMGGWNLHQLTQEEELDFFVSFSSIAAVWGSRGQGHYAAANHFLEALAAHRQFRGLAGQSVNWGPWMGGGMATEEGQTWLQRAGVRSLDPVLAVQALAYLLGDGRCQTVVADVDWSVFKDVYEARQTRGRLLNGVKTYRRNVAPHASTSTLGHLETLSSHERETLIMNYMQESIAAALGISASQVNGYEHLSQLIRDSLMAVELRHRLQRDFKVSLPMHTFMTDTSVFELAASIHQQLLQRSQDNEQELIEHWQPMESGIETMIWLEEGEL
jgi:myxalamid-type polyketide synthase MxaE and MxaD